MSIWLSWVLWIALAALLGFGGLVLARWRRRRRDAEALDRAFVKHGGRRVIFPTYDRQKQEEAMRRRQAGGSKN